MGIVLKTGIYCFFLAVEQSDREAPANLPEEPCSSAVCPVCCLSDVCCCLCPEGPSLHGSILVWSDTALGHSQRARGSLEATAGILAREKSSDAEWQVPTGTQGSVGARPIVRKRAKRSNTPPSTRLPISTPTSKVGRGDPHETTTESNWDK